MKSQQMDIFRHRQPAATDWLAAAEAARRNPYESPADAERRARYYEEQASLHRTTNQEGKR